MKKIIWMCVLFVLPIICGCEEGQVQTYNSGLSADSNSVRKDCIFAADKIKFNQLTEYVGNGQINVYADVLDQFGSRIKASGVWRFELFQYEQRTPESRGARVYLWKDIDLTDAGVNFSAWQDYLRCYKIELVFEAGIESGKKYILQAICTTAEGKRITDSVDLKM
ncbi:MAG: hypothetical protein WC770_07920 [Phycisphaerae bacterium]|jgi:hypothetical protein